MNPHTEATMKIKIELEIDTVEDREEIEELIRLATVLKEKREALQKAKDEK